MQDEDSEDEPWPRGESCHWSGSRRKVKTEDRKGVRERILSAHTVERTMCCARAVLAFRYEYDLSGRALTFVLAPGSQ